MPPQKNTQADMGNSTFTHTDCGTDFINADKDTLSIRMREEHKLWMFQNSVQLWSERDDVTGVWRRLLIHNLYKLKSSPIIIRMVESRHSGQCM